MEVDIYLHIHGGRYTWRLIYICTYIFAYTWGKINMEVDIYLHKYICIYMEVDIHGGWSIFAQELMEGSPRSSQSVNSLTHEKAEVNIRSEQVLFWNDKKTSTTFIIHIQKRNNHQSTLLSAKNYIQLWSLLLPMTSYTNIYLDMTIDLQL